jgi:hypothetical protein
MQQWSLLRETGIKSPDPIKIFYDDLSTEISNWKTKGYDIILMLNANEAMGDRTNKLGTLVGKHELEDLIFKNHKNHDIPSTYARGSKRIDFIFGTRRVANNCHESGILPFGIGYSSDHRALFIRVDVENVLQSTTKKMKFQPWSPTFGAAISRKAFWKIALSLKMTHKRPSNEYITWALTLGIDDVKALDESTIKRELREAQKILRELGKKAESLREDHLKEMIMRAEDNEEDPKYQKRLQVIKKAHERQQHY